MLPIVVGKYSYENLQKKGAWLSFDVFFKYGAVIASQSIHRNVEIRAI